jgi:hypothetical protein
MTDEQIARELERIAEMTARSMIQAEVLALAAKVRGDSFCFRDADGDTLRVERFSDGSCVVSAVVSEDYFVTVVLPPEEVERLKGWL